jgi:hypothetical protein
MPVQAPEPMHTMLQTEPMDVLEEGISWRPILWTTTTTFFE